MEIITGILKGVYNFVMLISAIVGPIGIIMGVKELLDARIPHEFRWHHDDPWFYKLELGKAIKILSFFFVMTTIGWVMVYVAKNYLSLE